MSVAGSFLKKNPSVFVLIAMVGLAFLVPELGAREGPLKTEVTTKAGIMVIFLLQGLALKTRELANGVRDLRIHAFVQAWIFVFAGIVLGLAGISLRMVSAGDFAQGFFYLALVPTTIASAVGFTSASGGNVSAAIFNTTFSNILGVFWVPTACLVIFSTGGGPNTELLGPLLIKLAWLILLPLALGQIIRPFVFQRSWFSRVSPHFKKVNHGIILFIVFATFAQSVLNDTWSGVSAWSLFLLLSLILVALLLIHAGVWISSGWFLQSLPDRKAALFCGSQKTLAAGTPMAIAIFGSNGSMAGVDVSLLLLPLLCYHPMQLLLAALLLPHLTD